MVGGRLRWHCGPHGRCHAHGHHGCSLHPHYHAWLLLEVETLECYCKKVYFIILVLIYSSEQTSFGSAFKTIIAGIKRFNKITQILLGCDFSDSLFTFLYKLLTMLYQLNGVFVCGFYFLFWYHTKSYIWAPDHTLRTFAQYFFCMLYIIHNLSFFQGSIKRT